MTEKPEAESFILTPNDALKSMFTPKNRGRLFLCFTDHWKRNRFPLSCMDVHRRRPPSCHLQDFRPSLFLLSSSCFTQPPLQEKTPSAGHSEQFCFSSARRFLRAAGPDSWHWPAVANGRAPSLLSIMVFFFYKNREVCTHAAFHTPAPASSFTPPQVPFIFSFLIY